jgi:hypothetical protein
VTADAARDDRLPVVDLANRALERVQARTGRTGPALDPKSLIYKAERREGVAIEPGHWQDALAVLTDDLQQAAALNSLGRVMAHGQLVGILRQRIRAARLWHSQPDVLASPIRRPVIILGQMRSGTTLTQRLLASDPRFSFTRLYETSWPMVQNPLVARSLALLVQTGLHLANPQLRSVHPTTPSAPEEEFGLHALSLHGAMFEAQWHVPNFTRWEEDRDLKPVYREFHQLLQTLRWRRRERPDAIQLLKAPQFMQDLDAVLDEFPDARILLLEREPAAVMASSASLVWNQQRIQSNDADPRLIGREWRRKTMLREERARSALARLPSSGVLRLDFTDLSVDWVREVERVYDFLDLPLAPSILARMQGVARSELHHGHLYSPGQFGLDAETPSTPALQPRLSQSRSLRAS